MKAAIAGSSTLSRVMTANPVGWSCFTAVVSMAPAADGLRDQLDAVVAHVERLLGDERVVHAVPEVVDLLGRGIEGR